MEIRFFDWDNSSSFLQRVAEELVGRYRTGRRLNLGSVIVALPGSHAMGQLEVLIARLANTLFEEGSLAPDWIPPTFLTVGKLPTVLYPKKMPLAGKVTQAFAWQSVLHEFAEKKPNEFSKLFPNGLSNDMIQEMQLGRMLGTLHRELVAEDKQFSDVWEEQKKLGIKEEVDRWDVLRKMQLAYLHKLDEVKLWDAQTANLLAVRNGECQTDREIYLIGAVDLNLLQKKILQAIGDHVHLFVYAPESMSERFDEFGCVRPEKWQTFEFPIDDRHVCESESVIQEAPKIADWLLPANINRDDVPQLEQRLRETAVCIPNEIQEELIPFLEEEMAPWGVAVIPPGGVAMRKTRLYSLLKTAADWLGTRSYRALSDLLRHPDIDNYLQQHWKEGPFPMLPPGDWLTQLDKWQAEKFPEYLEFHWFDDLLKNKIITATDKVHVPESGNIADSFDVENGNDDGYDDVYDESDEYSDTPDDDALESAPETSEYKRDYRQLYHVAVLIENLFEGFLAISDKKTVLNHQNPNWSDERNGNAKYNGNANDFDDDEKDREDDDNEDDDDSTEQVATLSKALDSVKRIYCQVAEQTDMLIPWCEKFSNFLNLVYFSENNTARLQEPDFTLLSENSANQTGLKLSQINAGFKVVFKVFTEFAEVPLEFQTKRTGSQFLRLLLECLNHEQLGGIMRKREIPLIGWLDAAFENAPYLAITGMNEGRIPTAGGNDMFLPDSIRGRLVLTNSSSRLARDIYIFSTLCASRPTLRFFFERRTLEGDSILPSRFLLGADRTRIAERICHWFPDESAPLPEIQKNAKEIDSSTEATSGSGVPVDNQEAETQNATFPEPELFRPPVLKMTGPPPEKLGVSSFKQFLQSPYVFFLEYLLKLKRVRDNKIEMDASQLGTLVHDTLQNYAEFTNNENYKHSQDEDKTYSFLSRELDRLVRYHFGKFPGTILSVQVEQQRKRLWRFAKWQTAWAARGNMIFYHEIMGNLPLMVDNTVMNISGRIDRIDYNPSENQWYIFDYKTFETKLRKGESSKKNETSETNPMFTAFTGNEVDKKHRSLSKKGQPWTNLQLPLYQEMFAKILQEKQSELDPEQLKAPVKLGYIVLPAYEETKALGVPWTVADHAEAMEIAHWVIRTIRRLWHEGVDPTKLIDEQFPERGLILDEPLPSYQDDFFCITGTSPGYKNNQSNIPLE